jgi:TPP-dependent pyruvate/acetoin dehydrogenase alpha subunit
VESKNTLLEYLSKMLVIRYFEEKIDWMFSRDMLGGTAHLCIGQEAVAVGASLASRPDDLFFSTHRGHGHLLAKGADPKKLMCEIMGKSPGYCRGLGGTQHVCAKDLSFLGTNGITGGGIPIATGVGLALKLQKKKQVVFCFFGDGASNQGTFHESLNMASIWKLPVVYVCENNLYAMSTPVAESMNIKDIAARAKSYNMASWVVDGMDVIRVKNIVSKAVNYARSKKGPVLVEAKTYRYCGHSKSDPCAYRAKSETVIWRKKDPVISLERSLVKQGVKQIEIDALKTKIQNIINAACDYASKAEHCRDIL